MEESATPMQILLNLLEAVRSHQVMHTREQGIEPKSKPRILGSDYQLGEEISNHLFGHTKDHVHIPQTHTTTNKMVPDEQVSYISQPHGVRRYVQACLGVRVEAVRLRAAKPKEADHVLSVKQLLAGHTSRDELC